MTELIVALDGEMYLMVDVGDALFSSGVTWFKVGPQLILQPSGMTFVENMMRDGGDSINLFLDLKLYDTRDTVYNTARRAFDLGARFLTVHATPSMLEAAMRAKPAGDRCKVLAVSALTDGNGATTGFEGISDGMICPVDQCAVITRPAHALGKIIVCPGIRPKSDVPWLADNHINPATPAEAKAAGADYIVCGRPIYQADDPVAAARTILEELR